jgi:hypothetical protein
VFGAGLGGGRMMQRLCVVVRVVGMHTHVAQELRSLGVTLHTHFNAH